MKKRLIFSVLGSLILVGLLALVSTFISMGMLTSAAEIFETNESIDQFMRDQMRANQVPSAALAVIENGEIRYMQGYSLDEDTPITDESIFQIGSVSKPLTAWAIMRLVETGQLDLDAPIYQYLTRWSFPQSSFDIEAITTRRVLSHTAGLTPSGYRGFAPDEAVQTLEESLNNAADSIPQGGVYLVAEPATEWRYAGGGYTVLQLLIEEITGQSFSEYLQTEVLTPLGMTNTQFSDTLPATLVNVYDMDATLQPAHRFSALAAAGGTSNARDLAVWLRATVSADGETILSRPTRESMWQPQPAAQMMFSMYGLGYSVSYTVQSSTLIAEHSGSNDPGWRAYIGAIPSDGAALAILTNSPQGEAITYQTSCVWVAYAAQDVTESCLANGVLGVLPALLIVAVFVMVIVIIVSQNRKLNSAPMD